MEPPVGFVRLRDAVDEIGRKIYGPSWQPLAGQFEHVVTLLAEECEAGRVAAAYRHLAGVEPLNPAEWHKPHWRTYFDEDTITLELPLYDDQLRPTRFTNPNCRCKIFVRKSDLARLIGGLKRINRDAGLQGSRVSVKEIKGAVAKYLESQGGGSGNSHGMAKFAHDQCGIRGHRDELRAEYQRQVGGRPRGRPTLRNLPK
jgi:hypothetical protein